MRFPYQRVKRRRGTIVVLAAFLMVVMLGMIAFALDVGYIGLARTQLQVAADSAALAAAASTSLTQAESNAVAQQFANANMVAGRKVHLNAGDIEYGVWDIGTRTFTPSAQAGTAVRVTVRTDPNSGGKTGLFFGSLFNLGSVSQQASAVATVNPRDIAFVVDLSGTMNNDTEPIDPGDPGLMQAVYDDFGFGTYSNPGVQEWAGKPLLSSGSTSWNTNLTKNKGPLRGNTIPARYKVLSSDSKATKEWKAYAWVMEVQIPKAGLMPAATPTPNADTNYAYWKSFIDTYPTKLGYCNYVQFMMDQGREQKPGGTNYSPLSLNSGIAPMHPESTAGGTFSFPPREMPTHAARQAMIAAIQVIKERNQSISNPNQRDWVSIISFDKPHNQIPNDPEPESPRIVLQLTSDYNAAMQACTLLQACSDSSSNTSTESGLILARNHIKPDDQGGAGRRASNKIIVLLTDGQPNLKINDPSSYVTANPSTWTNPTTGETVSNWLSKNSPNYLEKNAALMQTSLMQGDNWYLYPVGIGLGCDYDFMDRVARMGVTANNNGQSPRGSGNSGEYEAVLVQIFNNIITNPKLRLVQ